LSNLFGVSPHHDFYIISLEIIEMGQGKSYPKIPGLTSTETANKHADILFGDHSEATRAELVNEHIDKISRNFSEVGSFGQR
jgi:hypothetical protein